MNYLLCKCGRKSCGQMPAWFVALSSHYGHITNLKIHITDGFDIKKLTLGDISHKMRGENMPTISSFSGIVIVMYLKNKEHNPPHIHAITQDYAAHS